ncbi:unnamed protein product [Arabidopsis arenosa]|uniref:SEC7 domain-containing protein n=1 Tax=Arabidopsis arenosa TaxID=38785 RepID=A0A8S1ZEP4_ARAAE|nr:unnamed protein product [Arabidopsis arenosa]
MASTEVDSRLGRVVIPALDKVIKNASWRKHSKLAHECKSVIERLRSPENSSPVADSDSGSSIPGPLHDGGAAEYSLAESEIILSPLINASSTGVLKIVDPAVDCIQKLIAHGYVRGEADPTGGPEALLLSKLIETICKCHELDDEGLELLVLKTLLTAVTSISLRIHGDSLLQIVRTCYGIYLGSRNVVNQATAKASLVQMSVIVFRRMEADSSTVPIQPIVVAELMEPMDKSESDPSTTQSVQGFITKIMQDIDGVFNSANAKGTFGGHDGAFETSLPGTANPTDLLDSTDKDMLDAKYWEISMYKSALEGRKGELADGEVEKDDDSEVQIGNKLRRDAFLVFRALCKLSMKTPPKEDPELMRGKIVALELLKILLENAGAVFRTSDRFLGAIKHLVSRFRAGLKAEIGVFFPMIVLRVLENVAQPDFQQKMIVLRFLDKLCVDSQILVDIFINYDCDVNSSNIFERMVNGLLKTAQGVPPGIVTTLLPPQEASMKLEAMKCLVAVLRSMGDWVNKQLRLPDPYSAKIIEIDDRNLEEGSHPVENGKGDGGHGGFERSESQSELSSGTSDALAIEQRRAYKLELQEGISIFNQKPKKGIEFLIKANKVGDSPEEIAAFLKDASGLNKTLSDTVNVTQRLFSSADTAYVLAYSVILLNTDAHNPMVKSKMTADGFIRNNRGIDDGKDLPEDYLRALYERISRNEIKMKDDGLGPQQKQPTNSSRLLGLDTILNIVVPRRGDDMYMETSDDLIRHMQERFKEKARKSESVYYAASDVVILRFMVEVCWAPMLAAFSVPLDQSDDAVITTLCLEGFHHAIHVTSVMSLKTHRDAFVTSLAKFTSLHSPADIKQKNIEAIKAIVKLAEEEGNYLQDAWEHILTCVSRFEHLHLLGEGAPPDATFFAFPQTESGNSPLAKPNSVPAVKERAPGKLQYAASAVIRGSYDGSGVAGKASNTVTSEQMNNLISNLNLLEQVGDMSRIFTRSQRLNSEAIIDFVKALCKVSMDELRSPSDPRVFSLTKIVEIAHYNMNRIRLVWSSIWHVLSDFFVTIGCSDNLSIAIFAMDSLRQLSMKFLEREELANYNFQNEFMKPFVVVMRKSGAVEIRELIIRCVSQMVLSRVDNVKSGWKSMFMIFTTAAHDAHKNIVFLSFEMVEKIIRDYFPHITETETTTFTDCVNCLVAFTNCKFEKDISLQAIAFLQYCARKLAEGYVGSSQRRNPPSSPQGGKSGKQDSGKFLESDEHLYSWFPLLAGLSELSFDPRAEIRKVALKVLFDTLRNHGDHFSLSLWERVFESVLFRIFDYVRQDVDPSEDDSTDQRGYNGEVDQESWLYETCSLALQLVVDLFVNFYKTVNPLLKKVLMLFVSLIKRPHQSLAGAGIAALVRLMRDVGHQFSDEQWLEVVSCIKEAADATAPDFSYVTSEELTEDVSNEDETNDNSNDALRRRNRQLQAVVADAKSKASIQIFVIQAVTDIYDMYRMSLTANHMLMLFDAMHGIGSNAHKINADLLLRSKLQELGLSPESQEAPLLRLENESFQTCMTFLDNLISDQPVGYNEAEIETHLISLCREVLEFYINISCSKEQSSRWAVPSGSGKKKELTARAPLVVAAIQTLGNMGESLFKKNLPELFPLIATLISCEHGSGEVQIALSDMLQTSMGPVVLRSCC